MIAITPSKIFSKEVAQKQATPFARQDLLTARNRFRPNFRGWGLDENLKPKIPPYRGPHTKAPSYPESQAVKDFRYNAYFGESLIPKIDGESYKLNLSGLVDRRRPWTLPELYELPQESQVTRLVCVEGWSMIGKWAGVPFRTFLQRIGAEGYYSSIDMASALHPQTFLTLKISDEILAPRYGYPLKLRIPTKLGFKNPKWITAIFVTNRFPGGFWEDRGYNWFAGV
jgi:DMSO/TMAO reductase YedYZ molybdopterin-dependent catalytic subunit